jgi:hypothetical protein
MILSSVGISLRSTKQRPRGGSMIKQITLAALVAAATVVSSNAQLARLAAQYAELCRYVSLFGRLRREDH